MILKVYFGVGGGMYKIYFFFYTFSAIANNRLELPQTIGIESI